MARSAPRSSIVWRRRSVRTRVFPEPAGAITRAPPAGWLTAASWSGARSASGGWLATADKDPASVFHRCTTPMPEGRGGGANGPPSTYRGVPSDQQDVSRTCFHDAVIRKASGGLASVPPDRVSAPGVIVVGPDEELKALPRELEPGAEVIHRPLVDLRNHAAPSGQGPTPRPPAGAQTMPDEESPARAKRVGEGFGFDDEPGALLPRLRWGPLRAARQRHGQALGGPGNAIG